MTVLFDADLCGYCSKPSDALLTYRDGLSICPACRDREQQRYAAATDGQCNRCPYHLDWHVDGQCPTESQARSQSGSH